jgi:carboxypeptidase family protein
MNRLFGLALCASLAWSSSARAQGVQTGTITGIVQSADGLSLPGVSVTATSPSLQGQRAAATDINGVYFIKGLPAGIYSLKFDIRSFQTATTNNIVLVLGGVAEVNQTLTVAGRTETVSVTAEAPSPIATTTLGQAFTKKRRSTRRLRISLEFRRYSGTIRKSVNDINANVSERLFFGPRGVGDFRGYGLLDLALIYGVPIWKSARPWLKVEFYNLLNNQKQMA